MPDIKLDQVQQRYLVKRSSEADLNQLQLRYLVKDTKLTEVLTYKKTPYEYLLSAINDEQALPVKAKYISFSAPISLDDDIYNTSVLMTVDRAAGVKGSKVLKYMRAPISDIVENKDITEEFKPNQAEINTTRDVLVKFNEKYGTLIPVEDILDVPVIEFEEVVFTATAESYLFIPGSTANLGVIKGSDKYVALPTDTLKWSPELLEGVWTQGLDISLMYKGLTSNTTYVNPISDEFIRQFYDDVSQAPTSQHPRVTGRPLTQRSTTAPVISDRARTDCIYAVTVIPLGTTVPVIFHYDSRQR